MSHSNEDKAETRRREIIKTYQKAAQEATKLAAQTGDPGWEDLADFIRQRGEEKASKVE